MDWILLLKAALMGVVEGLTEFLPISSTGHLILVGDLIGFNGVHWDENKAKVFEIIIQAAAILAVCWEYRSKLLSVACNLPTQRSAQRFVFNLALAFLPAAILGFFFHQAIQAVLFKPLIVACALIVGGLIILWVERQHARAIRISSIDDIRSIDALKIGLIQALALIPGTSRSGATIIGGLWLGLSRQVATEFSFFLAIPTLFAATAYSAYKERANFTLSDLPVFSLGFLFTFISAFICVRWLLRYISRHDFTIFAWYRIVFGGVILLTAYTGWISWTR